MSYFGVFCPYLKNLKIGDNNLSELVGLDDKCVYFESYLNSLFPTDSNFPTKNKICGSSEPNSIIKDDVPWRHKNFNLNFGGRRTKNPKSHDFLKLVWVRLKSVYDFAEAHLATLADATLSWRRRSLLWIGCAFDGISSEYCMFSCHTHVLSTICYFCTVCAKDLVIHAVLRSHFGHKISSNFLAKTGFSWTDFRDGDEIEYIAWPPSLISMMVAFQAIDACNRTPDLWTLWLHWRGRRHAVTHMGHQCIERCDVLR